MNHNPHSLWLAASLVHSNNMPVFYDVLRTEVKSIYDATRAAPNHAGHSYGLGNPICLVLLGYNVAPPSQMLKSSCVMLVNLPGSVRLLIKESKLRLLPFALTGRGKCMFGDKKGWPVII